MNHNSLNEKNKFIGIFERKKNADLFNKWNFDVAVAALIAVVKEAPPSHVDFDTFIFYLPQKLMTKTKTKE